MTKAMMKQLHISIFSVLIIFIKQTQQIHAQIELPVTQPIQSFCLGESHGCALFQSKKFKCWGSTLAYGKTSSVTDGQGDTLTEIGDQISYIDVGTTSLIEEIYCGSSHTCVRFETKVLKCIGNNIAGQIGIGSTTAVIGEVSGSKGNTVIESKLGTNIKALEIALGNQHSCIKVTGNKVKCFGLNDKGQLGYGDVKNRGNLIADMGDKLPYLELGAGTEVTSIHSGPLADHTCVILSKPLSDAQKIKCWGFGETYALGNGIGTNIGTSASQMGDSLLVVDLGSESKVSQLAIGSKHTCAMLVSQDVKCFGYGADGQLASGDTSTMMAIGDSIPFVGKDAEYNIDAVIAGQDHTCVMYDDEMTVKCVGKNDYGQLGQGDIATRGNDASSTFPTFTGIAFGKSGIKIKEIHAGGNFNCVIFSDNTIKCFGRNNFGQLAIGTSNNIGDEAEEMGGFLGYTMLFSPTQSPTTSPTKKPTTAPTPPTKAPTQSPTPPTSSPTKSPTMSPTPPTKSPTQSPSAKPTTSPTRTCGYPTSKLCKKDSRCSWEKVGKKGKQCVYIDCSTFAKKECVKNAKNCSWDKKENTCKFASI